MFTYFLVFVLALSGIPEHVSSVITQPMPPTAFIQPQQSLLPVGLTQAFQLSEPDGKEGASSDWVLSDPEIAELKIDGNHVTVTGKKAGHITLSNSSGAQAAEIDVHDGRPPMPSDSRWVLQPVDGHFTRALWASGTWGGSLANGDAEGENSPGYYYEDRGPAGAHIRGIRKDGLQAWQWPDSSSTEIPRMICGDMFGGVLVEVGQQTSGTLVDLDANGHERWRVAAPGFSGMDFTYTGSGMFYFVEERPNFAGGRIVGLDGHDGSEKFEFDLQASQETLRGFVNRSGTLICSPNTEGSTTLPLRHSKMMANKDDMANFAYSDYDLEAEAPNCAAGATITQKDIRIKVRQQLLMVDIHEDVTASTSTVEENTAEGSAADTWIQASVPVADIICGEEGTGNFLAVRHTSQTWRGTGPGKIENFQYRIGEDRKVKYRFPVPLGSPATTPSMLLGENDFGYTTRGNIVIAFNTATAKEIWRWESTKTNVEAIAALKDDSVLVRQGSGYTILKDGKAKTELDENYMLFVFKFVPN